MATTYVTPGLYLEEIANLPRSVAQVPTADPGVYRLYGKAHDLTART